MPRRPPGLTTNGSNTIHVPGAYRHVLEEICNRDAMAAAADYLLLANSEVPEWECANAQRKAALMAERNGKPIMVMSYMLPPGLPPPFENWPRGGSRRSFVVSPDDTIRLKVDGHLRVVR